MIYKYKQPWPAAKQFGSVLYPSRSPSLLGVEVVSETTAFQRWRVRRAKGSPWTLCSQRGWVKWPRLQGLTLPGQAALTYLGQTSYGLSVARPLLLVGLRSVTAGSRRVSSRLMSRSQTKKCNYISSLVKIKTQYEGVGIFFCHFLPFSPFEALLKGCHLLAFLQLCFSWLSQLDFCWDFWLFLLGGCWGCCLGFFLGGGGSPPGFDKFNHFLADYLYQEPGSSPWCCLGIGDHFFFEVKAFMLKLYLQWSSLLTHDPHPADPEHTGEPSGCSKRDHLDREDWGPWSPLRSIAFPCGILPYFLLPFLTGECFLQELHLLAFHHWATAEMFFFCTFRKCAKEKGRKDEEVYWNYTEHISFETLIYKNEYI